MLQRVIEPVIKRAAPDASALVVTSVLTVFGLNVLTANYYVAIVLTAQMYRGAYKSQKLKPVILSTAIADGGWIASPIIPWNVRGAAYWRRFEYECFVLRTLRFALLSTAADHDRNGVFHASQRNTAG